MQIEKDIWINQRTGEAVEARQSLRRVSRENFEIVYLSYFTQVFDELGGKKYQVLKYILANRSNDNTLITTVRELAKNAEVSIQTVNDALKVLRDAKIISTRVGAIILNPKIINRGSLGKEAYIMQKFETFDNDVKNKSELKQTNLLDHC